MKYRHEWKQEISYSDLLTLRMRLKAVMRADSHSIDNRYLIRSLYFDTPNDKALREKTDGVNQREKFRLRYYNNDTAFIVLEKKSKMNGLCSKDSVPITEKNAQQIVNGDIAFLAESWQPLYRELYVKMLSQQLHPKTIVDYTREPFVYPVGNVRVTIDYDIRTGDFRTDFLNPTTLTLPTGNSPIVLEVKWDEFLPDFIKSAVTLPARRAGSFSKYEQSRCYG